MMADSTDGQLAASKAATMAGPRAAKMVFSTAELWAWKSAVAMADQRVAKMAVSKEHRSGVLQAALRVVKTAASMVDQRAV